MDAAERELFTLTVGKAVADASGADLDDQLAALGWAEALADDEAAAVSALFEAQGATGSTSSALDLVLAHALGAPLDPTPAVVLPSVRRTTPPGQPEGVMGVGSAALSKAAAVLVVVDGADGPRLATVQPATLQLRPVEGVDPALGLVEVSGELPTSAELLPAGTWDEAVAAGQRALGHQLAGASRTMLQLARDHAVDRIQFGVPIATFQAVRHRLAEALVAVEAADAALDAAWIDGTPLTATLAKAVAGRSARTVARHAQQVLAGVGFTKEHDFHRFYWRTLVLDRLLGDTKTLTEHLGQQLLTTRQVPNLLPL